MDHDDEELRRRLRAELTSARRLHELASQCRSDALGAAFDANVLSRAEVARCSGLTEEQVARLEAIRHLCSGDDHRAWLPRRSAVGGT